MRLATADDAILLIEDGVYAAMKESQFLSQIKSSPLIYALEEDIVARGITNKIASTIKLIDYAGLVDLTIAHSPIQTWS